MLDGRSCNSFLVARIDFACHARDLLHEIFSGRFASCFQVIADAGRHAPRLRQPLAHYAGELIGTMLQTTVEAVEPVTWLPDSFTRRPRKPYLEIALSHAYRLTIAALRTIGFGDGWSTTVARHDDDRVVGPI